MTNEELNSKIKSAFKNIAPDNFQSILSDSKEQKGSVVNMTTKKNNNFKRIATVAAAFVIVFAAVAVIATNPFGNNVVSSVSIDVNPSVNIQLDGEERVIDVIPFNEDGKKIIGTMDFKGSDLTVTINALVGSMLRNGFLSDITNSVLVTVEGDNHEKNEAIQKKVEAEIETVLKGGSFEAAILNQEILDEDDKIEAFAKKNNISEGKAELVHALAKELPNHTPEELAKLSINELNILAEGSDKISAKGEASKKQYIGEEKAYGIAFNKAGVKANEVQGLFADIETDDGVMIYEIEFTANGYEFEVEIHATTGDILSFDKDEAKGFSITPSAPAPETTEKSVTEVIGKEEAKKIALNKAGVTQSNITNYTCKLDDDDGVKVYEIEFYSGNYEYDVEIDALTGKIRDYENSYEDNNDNYKKPQNTEKPKATTTKPKATEAKPDKNDNYIGKERAKSIALNRAGVSAGNINGYKCEFDNDDAVAVYDVEFCVGKYEYSVEINAKTGAITDFDKDIDD